MARGENVLASDDGRAICPTVAPQKSLVREGRPDLGHVDALPNVRDHALNCLPEHLCVCVCVCACVCVCGVCTCSVCVACVRTDACVHNVRDAHTHTYHTHTHTHTHVGFRGRAVELRRNRCDT